MLKLYVTIQSMFIAGADRVRSDSEKGATAVEYGIMVALIAAVIVGLVALIGDQLVDAFGVVLVALGGTLPA